MPYRETETTRATRERKRAALIGAGRAVVAEKGFAGASVQGVAARAGVSTGSVYTHFRTKSDLLVAVFRASADAELEAVRRAAAPLPDDPAGERAARRLSRVVDTFARRALRRRHLAWSLLLEPVDAVVDAERLVYRRAHAAAFARIVTDGVADGEFAAQDAALAASALVGAVGEALTGPLSPLSGAGARDPEAVDAVVDGIGRFCLGAVGAAVPHHPSAAPITSRPAGRTEEEIP